jgi:hypothetical protein
MYAMLTGSPPFRGGQLTEVIDKQRRVVPPRVSSLVPEVPPELDELIARLLSKDPAQRPASALALGRLLAAIETLHTADVDSPSAAAGPVSTKPTTQPPADARPAAPANSSKPRPQPPAPPPTALERSNRPTAPIDPASRKPGPAPTKPAVAPPAASPPRPRGPDPLAPTQDMPAARQPADGRTEQSVYATTPTQSLVGNFGTAATAASAAGSRLPTDVASATTLVGRGPRNRHVTVEDYERAEEEQARRERMQNAIWQWLAAGGITAIMIAAAWVLLSPPSADTLHDRIMAIANDPNADVRDARAPIERFLDRYPDDARAAAVRDLKKSLDLDQLDRRARRPRRGDRGLTPIERDYRAAIAAEENGPSAFLQALQGLLSVHARPGVGAPVDAETSLWIDLARRQVSRLAAAVEAEQRDDADRIAKIFAEAQALSEQAATAVNPATAKRTAAKRRELLQGVVDVYSTRPHAAESVAEARRLLAADETAAPAESVPDAAPTAKPTSDTPPQSE